MKKIIIMLAVLLACDDLKSAYPDINWKEGRLLNGPSKTDLQKWVEDNR